MNKGKHTVSSIADALGVSRASVSRAFNNSPGVGTELRKQILEYAEQIGYKTGIPSPEATTTKSNVIGLVFGDIQNPFYSDLAYHVQKTLNEHGYSVIIFNSEYDPEKEIEFIEMADKFQLAGLLLFTTQTNMDYLYVQSRKIPIVFVNRFLDLKNYDSVISDNFQAGYIAAMRTNVAKVLDVAESVVNIKATTTEKLGFTGRGEGIAAEAVASIVKM